MVNIKLKKDKTKSIAIIGVVGVIAITAIAVGLYFALFSGGNEAERNAKALFAPYTKDRLSVQEYADFCVVLENHGDKISNNIGNIDNFIEALQDEESVEQLKGIFDVVMQEYNKVKPPVELEALHKHEIELVEYSNEFVWNEEVDINIFVALLNDKNNILMELSQETRQALLNTGCITQDEYDDTQTL